VHSLTLPAPVRYVKHTIRCIYDRRGAIDVLWASAGTGEQGRLGEITEEHFDAAFSLNARGTLFTVQKALPLFNMEARS